MFFFMDEMEPILPTFLSSTDYNDSNRIVELADVGCDTGSTFLAGHFPRDAFDRRRGGAENAARRNAKWRNERSKNLGRPSTAVNNGKMTDCDRKRVWDLTESTPETSTFDRAQNRGGRNYAERKMRRENKRNYEDAYIADVGYGTQVEDNYDDFELPTNDSTQYSNGYYGKFLRFQNTIGRSRKGRDVRYDYARDYKPQSPRGGTPRVCCKQNEPPRWFADNDERDFREVHEARSRQSSSSEHRKRLDTSPRMDKNFHHKSGMGIKKHTHTHTQKD